jgi:hypothetical protein
VTWDFPSLEVPDYLRQLKPDLDQAECERVAARFDEAVQLAERAFVEELQKLVAHLVERLSGQADGRPKVFRNSAVENLAEFFDRFRQLNVRSGDRTRGNRVVCRRSPGNCRGRCSRRGRRGTSSGFRSGRSPPLNCCRLSSGRSSRLGSRR